MAPQDAYLSIAKMIDHALLTPSMTHADLESGIELALAYNVASVCILPYYVRPLSERCAGTTVLPSTVIGFPHGAQATRVKQAEAVEAIDDGCVELDMVVNISAVLSGDWAYVAEDIRAVIEPAHAEGRKVKVIFENCYLEQEHKIRLCEICSQLKADWVKTSTGFGKTGATVEDIALMIEHSPAPMQVKAAGGIRDLATVLTMQKLGATRVGASRTKEILDELRSNLGLEPLKIQSRGSAGY